MTPIVRTVAQNLQEIRSRIAASAARSGRSESAVTLIGVTKYATLAAIRQLLEAGCLDLGESRPQQLWERAETLGHSSARWHLIGHLQRNKVRRTLPWTTLVHSVDSLRLASAIGAEAKSLGRTVSVLLEVNISGDAAKHGFTPAELTAQFDELTALDGVTIRGLMGMAGLESDLDQTRREFAALRELRDRLRPRCPPSATLDELSMGMSGDFETAIEEGATMVRVGSALFEGVAA